MNNKSIKIIRILILCVICFGVYGCKKESKRTVTTIASTSKTNTNTSPGQTETHLVDMMNDPDFIIFPEASTRRLTYEDLSRLTNVTLCRVAYNEIYARKGRIMNTVGMRQYFSRKSWYQGTAKKVTLTPLESVNKDLINNYANSNGWYWKAGDDALNLADLYIEAS